MRMDKWLWAARFFKTRELASKACNLKRVSANQQPAKPAREVRVGDQLRIQTAADEFEIEVLALSDQRGPAEVARKLYRESDDSRERRRLAAEERRLFGSMAGSQTPSPGKRPSKRDRRLIHSFRGDY